MTVSISKQRILMFAAAIIGLVVVFSLLAGSWVSKVGTDMDPMDQRSVSSTEQVRAFASAEQRYFSGQIQPRQESSVSSRITARVADVLVEAGDRVQQGDVLLRLESDDLSARVRQQQQSLAAAQARVNEARNNYQRVVALVEQGLLPNAALDEATAQRDTTEAELAGAREALSEAQTSERFSVIVAPFDGVISDRAVFTGDIASPGTQLVRLYQPESLRFEASVSESVLAHIEPGKAFMVHMDAHDRQYSAVVSEIVPSADAASRSFTVRLNLETDAQFYPGMYGRLSVVWDASDRKRLGVPETALETLGQLHYVYVLTSNGVERRLVRLGETGFHSHQQVRWHEVVAGLREGEEVVLQATSGW